MDAAREMSTSYGIVGALAVNAPPALRPRGGDEGPHATENLAGVHAMSYVGDNRIERYWRIQLSPASTARWYFTVSRARRCSLEYGSDKYDVIAPDEARVYMDGAIIEPRSPISWAWPCW